MSGPSQIEWVHRDRPAPEEWIWEVELGKPTPMVSHPTEPSPPERPYVLCHTDCDGEVILRICTPKAIILDLPLTVPELVSISSEALKKLGRVALKATNV